MDMASEDEPVALPIVNLDTMRDQQVRLHDLEWTDIQATFYYDETNNFRSLSIETGGLNVAELKVFVFGGVLHAGAQRTIDIDGLRKAMWIQSNASEIKFEHVAKGSFLDVLRSKKLATFLRWLLENHLVIHYHALDPFYWSIVDIVDSILSSVSNPMLLLYQGILKSDLNEALRVDTPATVRLFHRHGYPSLTPEARKPFLQELIALFDAHKDVLPAYNARILRDVLTIGLGLDKLVFIENNVTHRLIADFSMFYLSRIAVFNQSNHILDMEKSIRSRFAAMDIQRGGQPATDFRFVDSKAEAGVQVSDVVVGLLGKMLTYFTQTDSEQIAKDRSELSGVSLANAELLRDCISVSHDINPAFLHHVLSNADICKLDIFFRFTDGETTSA